MAIKKKGKEDVIVFGCQWWNNSGGAAPIAVMQQFGRIIEVEDNYITYKICKTLWIELTKKRGDSVPCDTCDEYICPKCYDKRNISADDDFLVVFVLEHKY